MDDSGTSKGKGVEARRKSARHNPKPPIPNPPKSRSSKRKSQVPEFWDCDGGGPRKSRRHNHTMPQLKPNCQYNPFVSIVFPDCLEKEQPHPQPQSQVVYVPYASNTREICSWWMAMKTSLKEKFRVDNDFDENLKFYQEERSDNLVLEPDEEGFNSDHVVIRGNKYEIVDETMDTSHAPPIVADNENPIEERDEGDDGYDTEQEYDMHEVEEGLCWFNQDDESDEDW